MTLVCWNPARDLMRFPSDIFRMQREIDQLVDSVFRRDTEGDFVTDEDLFPSVWSPAVDVAESDNEYLVKVELPGINKEDVKVTVQDSVLTILGEKKQETEPKNYHRVERSYGSFQRSFTLPTTVKADKVDATFKDGVLTIALPKAEEARPKEIDVKVK